MTTLVFVGAIVVMAVLFAVVLACVVAVLSDPAVRGEDDE